MKYPNVRLRGSESQHRIDQPKAVIGRTAPVLLACARQRPKSLRIQSTAKTKIKLIQVHRDSAVSHLPASCRTFLQNSQN